MRVVTKYIFTVTFSGERDHEFAIAALRGAAREWAPSSNESSPLCEIADQLEAQAQRDE